MDNSALTVSFDEETHGSKIVRKARENPMLPIDRLDSHTYRLFLDTDLPGLLEDEPLLVPQRMWYQCDGTLTHHGAQVGWLLNEVHPNQGIGNGHQGLTGCVIACAVGAYKFKRRGDMSMSVFLMQLRVAAQGTVVGFLTLGLGYSMINEYLIKPKSKD
uniref:HIG1 domain-containing protein n=1 Tax=Timema douglasi TaxID=61478 RepID=A0A7R8Z8B8_TIMDO|nr:unnamed protein product [Timema douglasi]